LQIRIRTKLLLTYLLLIVLSLTILAFAISGPLQNNYLRQVENELIKNARLVVQILEKPILEANTSEIDRLIKEIGQQIDSRITVIKRNGEVLGETHEPIVSMENHRDRPEFKTALAGKIGKTTRYSTTLNISHLYIALPLIDQGEAKAVIRLAVPILSIQETLAIFRETLFVGGLLASFIALLLSIWLARTFTRPIEEISKAAHEIAQGDLEQKVLISSNYELALLSRSINEMTASLKTQINETIAGKQRLEAVLKHMASGVMVVDRNRLIQVINPHAERIFAIKEEKVIGRPYYRVIRNFSLVEHIDQVLNKLVYQPMTCEFSTLYPMEFTLKAYTAPIIRDGDIEQIVIVFHDITALRRIEKMKSDFVANASHELRTPVASIKGFSETLLDGALEDEQVARRFIDIIDKEAGRLTELLKDLLDLSQIESKSREIEKVPTDILELLRVCVAYFDLPEKEEKIKISIEASEQLPKISANVEMLSRAFYNLIDNAIKYTPREGTVKITVAKGGDNNVVISITDTGIGISQEDLLRIFERFYRVDKARTREIRGTGLGLSIVKHIIEAHQGQIDVHSELGKGTTFIITLPLFKCINSGYIVI
jgi:two-component system phosphate regulon sensor histidine kinase PhoR